MKPKVLDNIVLELGLDQVLSRLHIDPDSEDAVWVEQMVKEARQIARPKVIYAPFDIDEKGDDYVVIGGIRFESRILRVNLDSAHRVFAYVASCGRELQERMESFDDMLMQYAADEICRLGLNAAVEAFLKDINKVLPGKSASMNPGSLPDWPLPEQQKLFALLGGSPLVIGVELSDSSLMRPIKSISGFRFATEHNFENCQLCPRENCPGRRAPYDEGLYQARYAG